MRGLSLRLALVIGLVAAATLVGAARADTVLSTTTRTDATGDSGTGPDLSALTVTTYADGTISFTVAFANRVYMQTGETVQIFVDLNNDGRTDLNFSVWPSHDPSYLSRWDGNTSDWDTVRQLPELVESNGSISIRLSLNELQNDSNIAIAPTIAVSAGSWTENSAGQLPPDTAANDWLPSATQLDLFPLKPTATTTTTSAATTTTASTSTTTSSTHTATAPKKAAKLPVAIEPIAPLTVKPGEVTVHIKLKSSSGPDRLFKVCAQLAPMRGVSDLTQCRSTESTGAHVVPFAITYRITHAGTTHVSIDANAGAATAKRTAVIHVT